MIEIVTTREQLERCWAIRLEVFVVEQLVPESEEIDALDTAPTTTHVLVSRDGVDLGTGRLLPDSPGHVHIGRVAVRAAARRTGVGRELMDALAAVALDHADEDGKVAIELSAQEQAMPFYAALGYEIVSGDRYLDCNIWHQDMVLHLVK